MLKYFKIIPLYHSHLYACIFLLSVLCTHTSMVKGFFSLFIDSPGVVSYLSRFKINLLHYFLLMILEVSFQPPDPAAICQHLGTGVII